jgi:tetratricopeptide (TPR) repeat protein
MAIQPQILALYAQLIVLPVNLSADYGLQSVRYLPLPVSVLILAALVVAAAFAIRSDRRMSLAVALVALPLLPVSNLFPIYRAAADRYLYLPMAGVAVALGLLLDAPWLRARGRIREACLFASVGAIALLGMGSIERQKVWTDSLNLWEDTARKNPLSSTAASGLGEALREVGRLPEAEQSIRVALRLSDEKRADPWAMLALILDEQGRPEEADNALRKALEIDPRLADPDGRVRSLAMERSVADGLQPLLERLNRP